VSGGTLLTLLALTVPAPVGEQRKELGCDVTNATIQSFAAVDGGRWREYTEKSDVAEANEIEVATISKGREVLVVIDSDTAGDIATHHVLCYANTGKLIRSSYEVRTAWGWGYQESARGAHFFDLKTGGRISVPKEPMDGAELAVHRTYRKLSDLPFASLMNRQPTTDNKSPTT
jgi:hypothetical protein